MFLIAGLTSVGQQRPQYTQYIFNYFAINPAVAGSQECMDFKFGYRAQWLGLPGAPSTAFATFNTKLKFKKRKSIRAFHGVGAYVENDVLGYFGRTTINLAYAYHFPIGREITLSGGVFAGLQQFKVDASKIVIGNTNDPLINGSGSAFLYPDISPGLFMSHKHWFAGFSIRQLIPTKWKVIGSNQTKNRRHYILTAGKRLIINEDMSFVPSFNFKLSPMASPALDINALLGVTENIEIGASWRNIDGIAGLVKFKFLDFFSLGYSFDFTTSKIRKGSSNTHEIVLGLYSCSQTEKYSCPAFN